MRVIGLDGRPGGLLLAGGLLLLLGGCSATTEAPLSSTRQSGFLGDYSRLQPGDPKKGDALLRWIDGTAQWRQYNKVMIDPVTYWSDEKSKLKPDDQEALVTYFRGALEKQFAEVGFQVVDVSGPGVLRLQVALTEADSSTAGLRTVSLVVPQARLLNTVQSLATGKYVGAGGAQAEFRLTDSVTGTILAEGLDKRFGGSSASSAGSFEWGDAEIIMDTWAKEMASRLHAWTTGAAAPGDPAPKK
ncbi:MAG: DUF3313 domain-containing protein [Candidatus Binatia bacterium]